MNKLIVLLFFTIIALNAKAQLGTNDRQVEAKNTLTLKAGVETKVDGRLKVSSTTKASAPCPNMTETQRNALTPASGDCVYNTTSNKLNVYDGGAWGEAGGSGTGSFENLLTDGDYEQAATSGQNGLTCGTGNTCSLTAVSGEFLPPGKSALKIVMSGSDPVNVKHCFDNTSGAWNDKMSQVSAYILTSIQDLDFCYSNNTSNEQCLRVPVNTITPVYSNKLKAFGGVNSGEKICYQLISASNPAASSTIFVDHAKASEFDIDGTTKNLTEFITYSGANSSITLSGNNLIFNTANISEQGNDLITVSNTGPTYTVFTALRDVEINGSFLIWLTSANAEVIANVNGVAVMKSNRAYQVNEKVVLPFSSIKLKQGEKLSFSIDTGSIRAVSDIAHLNMTATAYEQADVLSFDGFSGGSIKWDGVSGCNQTVTSSSFVTFNNASCTFASAIKTGAVVTPTTSGDIALKFAYVPAGRYKVFVSGRVLNFTSSGDNVCSFRLHDGTNNIYNVSNTARAANEISDLDGGIAEIEYKTPQTNLEIKFQVKRVSGTGNCQFVASSAGETAFSLGLSPITQTAIGTFRPSVNDVNYKGVTAFTATNNAFTRIDYNTLVTDKNNLVTTGASWSYLVPESGEYNIDASLTIDSTSLTQGQVMYLGVHVNGVLSDRYLVEYRAPYTGSYNPYLKGARDFVFTKNDQVDIRVYQNTGGGLSVSSNPNFQYVNIKKNSQAGVINKKADLPTQYNLTVTGNNSWTTAEAIGIPSQDSSGNWYLEVFIEGTTTSTSTVNVNITGILSHISRTHSGYCVGGGPSLAACQLNNNSNLISIDASSANTIWRIGGKFRLASKPTFVP